MNIMTDHVLAPLTGVALPGFVPAARNKQDLWAHRWRALCFVALLGFVLSANYTNHGPLVPTLVKELSITMAMAGLLTTAVFFTHGLLQVPGGIFADRIGAKRVITFGILIITTGNILTGMSDSYYALLAWKFFTGIGTGCAIVGGLRYVPTFFAGKEIQLAQGTYGGSILLGSGFVIYGVPQLLSAFGWHGVFFSTGMMAAVLLVLWHLFAPETPASGVAKKIEWHYVLGQRNTWLLSLAQLGSFGTIISAGVWVNTLLIRNLHLEPKTAGMVGSLVLLLGIASRPLGGVMLDRKWISPKALLVISHALLALGFLAIARADTLPVAIVAIVFTGITAGLPFGGIFNFAVYTCPNNPGLAMGVVNTWGAWGVMILPPIIGYLVDSSGSFVTGFYLLASVACLGAVASTLLSRRDAVIV
jgi:nitrate/nitrite transporter NarK